MEANKFKIHLVSSDLEGKEKEKGVFRFWSGYLSYDGKPISEVVGNHQTTPGTKEDKEGNEVPKAQWIALSESVSKDEREKLMDEGLDPESYGFLSIADAEVKGEPKQTAKLIQANIMGLVFPLAGWINRKEIEGTTYDTLGLSFKQGDYDFWEDKVETPFVLNDPETSEKEWNEAVNELSADYPQFQNFIKKFFPSSRVENANKRRDLLSKLKKKNAATKQAAEKEVEAAQPAARFE